MQNENSPSMNGLPWKFYKAMLDTIGDDFAAWHMRPSPQDFNQGLFKFIPKNSSRDSTGGWKHITFLEVAYNTLSKAIALQVHNVVQREQTSFVWGFISDTMISTWEAIEWARVSGQEAIFLKIDPQGLASYHLVFHHWNVDLYRISLSMWCADMINTLFSSASAFVSMKISLSLCILLHWSIQHGCPPFKLIWYIKMDSSKDFLEKPTPS